MDFTVERMAEFFEYLDDLRASGATNMFGAGPYLAEEFGLGRNDSRTVLSAWMKTFERDVPAEQRAKAALA